MHLAGHSVSAVCGALFLCVSCVLTKDRDLWIDSPEELEKLIHEKECEAAGINCNNTQALRDYQSRKKEAASFQKRLDNTNRELCNLESEAAEVKVGWISKVWQPRFAVATLYVEESTCLKYLLKWVQKEQWTRIEDSTNPWS